MGDQLESFTGRQRLETRPQIDDQLAAPEFAGIPAVGERVDFSIDVVALDAAVPVVKVALTGFGSGS